LDSDEFDFDPASDDEAANELDQDDSESVHEKLSFDDTTSKPSRAKNFLDNVVTAAENPRHVVSYTKVQPSYDHVSLSDLTLRSVFKFIDDVNEYQLSHGIQLPVASLISRKVREHLCAKVHNLKMEQFLVFKTKQVIRVLQSECRPVSVLEFQKKLRKHTYFDLPAHYIPKPSDFRIFHDALLLYRNKFLRAFEVMAADNEENIPECTNKEGGLIKIFVEKIPYSYGKNIVQSFMVTKFHDLYAFLKKFYKVVSDHYAAYELTTMVSQHFEGTEVANTERLPRPATYEKKTDNSRGFAKDFSRQRLHHIDEDEINVFAQDYDLECDDENSGENVSIHHASRVPLSPDTSLSAMAKSPKSDGPPNGCFQLLFHGTCPRDKDCSYSHDPSILKQSHVHYTELLAKSKYRSTTHEPAPQVFRKPGMFAHIIDPSSDVPTFDEFSSHGVLESGLADSVINLVRGALPFSSIATPVHREGCLLLADDIRLPVSRALFDSGALHGNYLSSEFVQQHFDLFRPYLKPCRGQVKLADNKTLIALEYIADLTTCFIDDHGKEHIGNVLFCVFPTTGNEIIIGLPAIITTFTSLFVSMIESAAYLTSPTLNLIPTSLAASQTSYPWTLTIDAEAPEDLNTPLPCSFTDALSYMEKSCDDSVAEYLSLIDSHVSPDFHASSDIVNLLKTVGVSVFVPANWKGVNGISPLELTWKAGLPASMKPKARPVNPRLFQHAKTEFDRLCKYFYAPSSSPIASCLVIAPKATPPFIRFCGDYVALNQHIETGHYPIPHVQHSLDKIITFSVFVDLDLVNSFHQFLLGETTSARLSVQTPWGQVQPKFMPEGIGPASGILQKHMSEIFADFDDWSIVIFDNMLILAHNYEDAYEKVKVIFQRCIDRNLFLKFSKSWLGFDSVLFFGYRCRHKTYELTDERKSALASVPFPTSQKQMQSFLGAALFFKSFVPHFSTKTAVLHDMTKTTFDWTAPDTWTVDYRAHFESLKTDLQHSLTLYYPDYNLPWTLRTDASTLGVGAVLFQTVEDPTTHEKIVQVIGCASEKFSPQASRWTTIEQEAYGIYFSVKYFSYHLHCQPFLLETDHNNLLWIESSAVPKIIRWRIYLQSFVFMVRHIPGKHNLVADYLSRSHAHDSAELLSDHSGETAEPASPDTLFAVTAAPPVKNAPSPLPSAPPEQLLSHVHGGRMGHHGTRKTWLLLNHHFPGHRIPIALVADFVSACPICQKDRLGMTDALTPTVRHLKPVHHRSMVGVDTLTITPPDDSGNCYLFVVINHYTKFCGLYPSPTRDATAAATALFQHFCRFGLVDCILSDPGSEFMNSVVEHLHRWLGIRHTFSLVDRHESNGVEGTNKQILRHLKALVFEERSVSRWSSPTVLPLIQYILNDTDSSETGVRPFVAQFGSSDALYLSLPGEKGDHDMQDLPAYVKRLDEDLSRLRALSKSHQDSLVTKRLATNHIPIHHTYQLGDFVLFQASLDSPLPSKLTPRFSGPYQVVSQHKNDIVCKHLVIGSIHTFHIERLKPFFGSSSDAFRMAMLDHDQHVVDRIISYLGDPLVRTTCEFEVAFADGTVSWLPYSKDIADTIAFETFVRSRPELFPLVYSAAIASRRVASLRQQAIDSIGPGDTIFVNLRSFGQVWYKTLSLPDLAHVDYYLEHKFTKWSNRKHTRIKLECLLTEEEFVVDQVFVQCYGNIRSLESSDKHVILTWQHALDHSDILPAPFRDKLLQKFRSFVARDT
jgi:hypothetical protein